MGREVDEINHLDISGRILYLKRPFDDLRFGANAVNPPGTAADPTWDTDEVGWILSNTITNTLQSVRQTTHQYSPGTALQPHIHCYPVAVPTGGNQYVCFELKVKTYNKGDSVPVAWDYSEKVQFDVSGALRESMIFGFPELDMTGMKESSIVKWEFSRLPLDALDNYPDDVIFDELDFHYEIDKIGTEEPFPT